MSRIGTSNSASTVHVRVAIKMAQKVAERIVDEVFDNLRRAGDHLADSIRSNISTPGPEASVPGDFPHRQSGDLQGSIRVYANRKTQTVAVVAEAPHAEIVEKMRPFMTRTLIEQMPEIERICTTRISAGDIAKFASEARQEAMMEGLSESGGDLAMPDFD